MIHVDLEEVKARFYQYGLGSTEMTMMDIVMFRNLDQWQKLEVLEAMKQGTADKQETSC